MVVTEASTNEAAIKAINAKEKLDITVLLVRDNAQAFDAMDTTNGRNTPKLQFSGFFPSSDFFSALRTSQASVDLLNQFALDEEDHGLERFITATRRQNFLIPPRRHRGFPLIELT